MTQDITVPGSPEPGPDNFDFEAWLDDESTFPVFKHKAYLDQASGAEYAILSEELDDLMASSEVLAKQIEARISATSNSFVDAVLDGLTDQRDTLAEEIGVIQAKLGELAEKIRKSAITLTFQVKTPEELGAVTREATRQFHKENQQFKNASEDDLDYMTARSRYMLTAQIAHFCTGMVLHKTGREVPPPTRQGADKLLTKLISSEMMRLMESMGQGLSSSQDWANKIDAGFPGGGSDVEEVGVGQDGAESRPVVDGPSLDHVDREALGLG